MSASTSILDTFTTSEINCESTTRCPPYISTDNYKYYHDTLTSLRSKLSYKKFTPQMVPPVVKQWPIVRVFHFGHYHIIQ